MGALFLSPNLFWYYHQGYLHLIFFCFSAIITLSPKSFGGARDTLYQSQLKLDKLWLR
jgi:hypothetical protein